jgi:hypothetical protein
MVSTEGLFTISHGKPIRFELNREEPGTGAKIKKK